MFLFSGMKVGRRYTLESVTQYFLSLCAILFQGYLNPTEEIPPNLYTWDGNRLGSRNIVFLFCIFFETLDYEQN
jgi:hypothetical protein